MTSFVILNSCLQAARTELSLHDFFKIFATSIVSGKLQRHLALIKSCLYGLVPPWKDDKYVYIAKALDSSQQFSLRDTKI